MRFEYDEDGLGCPTIFYGALHHGPYRQCIPRQTETTQGMQTQTMQATTNTTARAERSPDRQWRGIRALGLIALGTVVIGGAIIFASGGKRRGN